MPTLPYTLHKPEPADTVEIGWHMRTLRSIRHPEGIERSKCPAHNAAVYGTAFETQTRLIAGE